MTAPLILTTHVGSLIRPPALAEHMRHVLAGERVDHATYQQCLRESVAEVVKQQSAIGLDIVNDGEYGKSHWYRYVLDRFDGFEARPTTPGAQQTYFGGRDRARFPEFYAEYDKTLPRATMEWAATGPVRYKGQEVVARDIDNLKAALRGVKHAGAFLPVVAPASLLPELKNAYYKTEEEYAFAIADALRVEYLAIVAAGFTLQVDDAWLPGMYDRIVPPGTDADYRRWATMCIDALNHALRDIPEEKTRYHICWGSWNGPHTADLPLEDFVDLMLRIKVGAYSVEGANPRHEHEWRVWESVKLPEGRKLLPGVISHATNIVEHPKLVCERLVRLAKVLGPENVIGSSDCGFAQGALYQRVHPSIQWAKLQSLVEGAALASKQLAR